MVAIGIKQGKGWMKGRAVLGYGRLIGKCQTGQQEQEAYE